MCVTLGPRCVSAQPRNTSGLLASNTWPVGQAISAICCFQVASYTVDGGIHGLWTAGANSAHFLPLLFPLFTLPPIQVSTRVSYSLEPANT
jgi:hypothetical protein